MTVLQGLFEKIGVFLPKLLYDPNCVTCVQYGVKLGHWCAISHNTLIKVMLVGYFSKT